VHGPEVDIAVDEPPAVTKVYKTLLWRNLRIKVTRFYTSFASKAGSIRSFACG
jgi:hypothetical protein